MNHWENSIRMNLSHGNAIPIFRRLVIRWFLALEQTVTILRIVYGANGWMRASKFAIAQKV
jgi:hypothetical protein